jgi:hypothetical protein
LIIITLVFIRKPLVSKVLFDFFGSSSSCYGEIALIGRKFDRLKRRDNELPRLMTHIVYHIQSIFTIARKISLFSQSGDDRRYDFY